MPERPEVLEVTVIGAGVIGLTTALRLCEEVQHVHVRVIADRFDEDTTSAGAAGLWEPYKLSDTPPELIRRWGQETFQHLQACSPALTACVYPVMLFNVLQFPVRWKECRTTQCIRWQMGIDCSSQRSDVISGH